MQVIVRYFLATTIALLPTSFCRAVEGMWIPSLIEMFYSDMQTYGIKLTVEQIYSTNGSSLKDGVVQFNGGCTAELVSAEGLLFTNHHCGLDAIQKHSSTQNDYVGDGFWAKSKGEELSCPWLRVTFVREIRDVTAAVLKGTKPDVSQEANNAIVKQNILALEKENNVDGLTAKIKPFNLGNQFFMLITQDYNDIRLVGAPPACIGKFGGDADNWVWPRHTGDFAVFRIYAGADNQPAVYDATNKPYVPGHFFPISVKPRKSGDFTMVYGFPGQTDQHYASGKLKFYIDKERPARILFRQKALDAMKTGMLSDPKIQIQYVAKQARIANHWKKWIGQLDGLVELKAIDRKFAFEEEYRARAGERTEWKEKYFGVIDELNIHQRQWQEIELARAMYTEYMGSGPEIVNYAVDFMMLTFPDPQDTLRVKLKGDVQSALDGMAGFFKDYNKEVDQNIFENCTPVYASTVSSDLLPENFSSTWSTAGTDIFGSSVLFDTASTRELLTPFTKKSLKTLLKDPAIIYSRALVIAFSSKVAQQYNEFIAKEQQLMRRYVAGILEMFPDRKNWADANSTMRIAYGKIEGSAPHDGLQYSHFTSIDGVVQKHNPADPEFVLSKRYLDLYEKKDFGKYLQDGELWVCFTASNHTTGGNSGSPCIDAEGNLIGINFDRSWESTMSDFLFDESRCRNIMVDARYVLWVIETYGDAGYLLDEMKIVE